MTHNLASILCTLFKEFIMKKLIAILFLALSMTSISAFANTLKLTVNGMVCAFCAQGIEKKVKALPETKDVYVNLKAHLVVIELKDGQKLSNDTVTGIIKDAGYDVIAIEESSHSLAAIKSELDK